jgi:cytochrome P450
VAEGASALFSILAPGLMADPYPAYDRLREAAPVHWSAEENAWLLSRYAEVAEVMADPSFRVVELAEVVDGVARKAGKDVADLRAVLEAILFLRNPPAHGQERRFLVAVMNASPLATYRPMIEEVASALLERAFDRPTFDAVAAYADLLPPLFMGRLLGLSDPSVTSVVATVSEVTMTMDRGRSPRFYERVNGTVVAGRAVLAGEIARRRRRPQADGLSRMIDLSDAEFHLTDDEIASRALFLLIAGIETTSALIGNAVKAVLEHPDAARHLREEPGLIDGAIEEVVRFDSPAQQTTRMATQESVIGGQRIRPGDRLVLLLGAAHRDPAAYAEPAAFDIARTGPSHLGFGRGLHHCLGASLARLEARIALSYMLALRPEPVGGHRCEWWPHRTLRRLKSYPVTLAGPAEARSRPC